MAMQGQSVFAAAGDTGAFDCIRSDGTIIADTDDPSSQPWVTSVGGTSLESDNPDTNPSPGYPAAGESVWNPRGLCSESENGPGGVVGATFCAVVGAGGGGSSQYWGSTLLSGRTGRQQFLHDPRQWVNAVCARRNRNGMP